MVNVSCNGFQSLESASMRLGIFLRDILEPSEVMIGHIIEMDVCQNIGCFIWFLLIPKYNTHLHL